MKYSAFILLSFLQLAFLMPAGFTQVCDDTEVLVTSETGNWGSEMSWELYDDSGSFIASFNGETDFSTFDTTLCLADGCYLLEAYDSYGDGWNGGSVVLSYDNETLNYELPDGAYGTYYFGINDQNCVPFIPGCTDPMSVNYDSNATTDDGSCMSLQDVINAQIIDTICYGGPKDNRINWVIQNRGVDNPNNDFQSQAEFIQLYEEDLLLAFTLGHNKEIPPYAQYKNFFNLYASWWPDAPSDNEWWSWYILKQTRDQLFLPWANNETGWVTWFSTTRHGGGGGAGLDRDMRVGDGKMYGMGYETFLHEFGHTMPGLLDEYSASGVWSGGNCWETPNTTGFTTLDDIPWRLWIEPGTPLPTPYTEEYLDKFGAFEGAMTNYFGCHRPTARGCFMGAGGFGEGYGEQLCSVCKQRVICYLYKYVNVIENPIPAQNNIDVTGNETIHFSADVLRPQPNTQKYEWFLNGKLIAEGVEEVELSFEFCDDYELIFAVTDTNTLVRYDPKFEDTYPKPYREFKWQINQTEVNTYDLDSEAVIQHPDCTGNPNGMIEFSFSGGNGPFAVYYQGAELSNPVSDLAAGDYSFELVDANGCSIVKDVSFIQDDQLEPIICAEFSAGAWNLILETDNYELDDLSFQWSSGEQTPFLIGVPDGNYAVTVSTPQGCSVEQSITLTNVETALETEGLVIASEIDRNTGKIYLDITGGLAAYTIDWQDKTNKDITDTNVDNISASGTTWDHLPEYAFDNDLGTKWLYFVSQDAWISYYAEGGAVINYYTITSADDVPERDPKDWLFQGSDDGLNWTTLDQQTNQNFNSRFQKKAYLTSNSTAYEYYRFFVLENHGDGSIQLQELEFIGLKNSDAFLSNSSVQNQQNRTDLAPGQYIYTVKDANQSVKKDTLEVGYTTNFIALDLVVVQRDDCSVEIENPNPLYQYFWLSDEAASSILHIGDYFQPPASANYYVAAYDPNTEAMSSNRKGFAVLLESVPEVEVTPDNILSIVDPNPEMDYRWYDAPSCENHLHIGNDFVPGSGTGTYYVAAISNSTPPEAIDPASIPGMVIRMDAADINGDGLIDDPAPPTSSMLNWQFENGNYWSPGSWFAFRSNYQNGLGVADFATIWLQAIGQQESGYQTIMMAYEENALSFPETAPFEGLSQNIPKHTDASQLYANSTPPTTLNGSTFLNGEEVDPLSTSNPLEFCILGTKMTEISNAGIFYTDTQWEGKIGEIILWDSDLSDDQMIGVSEFLRKKWISVADLESPKTAIYWEDPTSVVPIPEDHAIRFYPNPATHQITIENLPEQSSIQFFNAAGNLIHQGSASSNTVVLDIRQIPSGVYFIQLFDENNKELLNNKFIKL